MAQDLTLISSLLSLPGGGQPFLNWHGCDIIIYEKVL